MIYFDVSRNCLTTEKGIPLTVWPALYYEELGHFDIILTSGSNTFDLSSYTRWRAALDTDLRHDTPPMIETPNDGITVITREDGQPYISVRMDTFTEEFRKKIDGKDTLTATFNLYGYKANSERADFVMSFSVTCRNIIAPTQGTPPTAPAKVFIEDLPNSTPDGAYMRQIVGGVRSWVKGVLSVAWDSITGKPETFPPAEHQQDWFTIRRKHIYSTIEELGLSFQDVTSLPMAVNRIIDGMEIKEGFSSRTDSCALAWRGSVYINNPNVNQGLKPLLPGNQRGTLFIQTVLIPRDRGEFKRSILAEYIEGTSENLRIWRAFTDGDGGNFSCPDFIEVPAGGGSGGIPEAPVDGKVYARKDAQWEEVQSADSAFSVETELPKHPDNANTRLIIPQNNGFFRFGMEANISPTAYLCWDDIFSYLSYGKIFMCSIRFYRPDSQVSSISWWRTFNNMEINRLTWEGGIVPEFPEDDYLTVTFKAWVDDRGNRRLHGNASIKEVY